MTALERYSPADVEPAGLDPVTRLVGLWLLSKRSHNTRQAYALDLGYRFTAAGLEPRHDGVGWLPFCAANGVAPLQALRPLVDAWAESMRTSDPPSTERTIARRLSAVSGWYSYLLGEEIAERNPVERVERPYIDPDHSDTYGPDREGARSLLRAAQLHGVRSHALVTLMLLDGLRVEETVGIQIEAFTTERGHRVVRIMGKGGKPATVPLAPRTARAVDELVAHRAVLAGVEPEQLAGPLFVDAEGSRLSRQAVFDLVQRLGEVAGLPRRLSPHGLRHAFVTIALDAGVPLRDVQDAARHKDPRTTRRYDRARERLDGHATYAVATYLAEDDEP